MESLRALESGEADLELALASFVSSWLVSSWLLSDDNTAIVSVVGRRISSEFGAGTCGDTASAWPSSCRSLSASEQNSRDVVGRGTSYDPVRISRGIASTMECLIS